VAPVGQQDLVGEAGSNLVNGAGNCHRADQFAEQPDGAVPGLDRIEPLRSPRLRARAMIANVEVENLDAAIPLYRELAGDLEVRRFPYKELEVALVGPFLLYSGPLDKAVDVCRRLPPSPPVRRG
jgi:hypothetical protein